MKLPSKDGSGGSTRSISVAWHGGLGWDLDFRVPQFRRYGPSKSSVRVSLGVAAHFFMYRHHKVQSVEALKAPALHPKPESPTSKCP